MPGLTSRTLLYLLAGLVLVAWVGLIWGWPRLAGRGAGRIALRATALAVAQATMLSLILVAANRAGNFYSSWSDLLGRYSGGGRLTALHESRARSASAITVLGATAIRVPGRPRDTAVLERVRVHGQISGITMTAHVYLPPGYTRGARAGTRYPVVVAISSAAGSRTSPYGSARLAASATREILAGRMRPSILVTLRPGPGTDRGCVNVPGGPQAAAFLTQDLPAAISTSYRVAVRPGGWGLLADASGGYCALATTLTSAAIFGAAALPPAGYQAPPGPPVVPHSPQFARQDNLLWLARHDPPQPVSVLFTGTTRAAAPFLALARAPMRAASTPLATGPWPLAHVLDWLGRALGPGQVRA